MSTAKKQISHRAIIAEFGDFDENSPIAQRQEIDRWIPQRFEMAQVDAILMEDVESLRVVGYKDVTDKEFWVRGHMPGNPLMPGVIMCECAAQLSAYFAAKYNLMEASIVGMGGLDAVKIRAPVVPGDRLVMMVEGLKIRPRSVIICRFQGFVRRQLAVEGVIKGVGLSGTG